MFLLLQIPGEEHHEVMENIAGVFADEAGDPRGPRNKVCSSKVIPMMTLRCSSQKKHNR